MNDKDFRELQEEVTDIVEEIMVLVQIANAKIKTAKNPKEIEEAVLESELVDLKREVSGVYDRLCPRIFRSKAAPPPQKKRRGRPPGSKNKKKTT